MMRILIPAAAIGAAMALAGCNEMAGGAAAAPVAAAPTAALSVPAGTPCANEINRFQTILKGDLDTGNVEQKVYDQIQGEMGRAAAACSAGKGAEAHRMVARSKASHGYRA